LTAPAKRELVRQMIDRGLSERRALSTARMSARAFRYAPRPDLNLELRQEIVALAHRHKRYGVGMIHLKLQQAGIRVNYKRVERLYQDAKLQVRRRKRKKVPIGERQPLFRPLAANEVWSMDFVFDRTAEGRVLKCLTIVDDATHEALVIEVERAVSGHGVARVLDRLALSRGLPKIIRSDNGKEFCNDPANSCSGDTSLRRD
jgi:transposase InsO family protein